MQRDAHVVSHYHDVIERLRAASEQYDTLESTSYAPPELIAVSKTHPADTIRPLLEAGHRAFGENRVQEAAEKWPALREDFPHIELHLIGPLQTNKAKDAVALFDVIHTVDREKLARILHKEMEKQHRHLPCLIQVNIGEEEQKAGVAPNALRDFYALCIKDIGLKITGLMCIPPADENPAPYFALMQELKEQCCHLTPETRNLKLSMGMSGDFELAAAMGADYVRVGSAIFGTRQ